MRKPLLLGRFLIVFLTQGSLSYGTEAYQKGKEIAHDLTPHSLDGGSVATLPEYQGDSVGEKSYGDTPESLKGLAGSWNDTKNIDSEDPRKRAAGILTESSNLRPHLEVSPQILEETEKITSDPLKTLNAEQEVSMVSDEGTKTIHKCQEPSKPIALEVEETLTHVTLIEKKIESTRHDIPRPNHSGGWCQCREPPDKCKSLARAVNHWATHPKFYMTHKYFKREVLYNVLTNKVDKELTPWETTSKEVYDRGWEEKPNPLKITTNKQEEEDFNPYPFDTWSGAEEIEELSDQGSCTYKEIIFEGEATRLVEGISIKRPSWKRKLVYEFISPYQDTCGLYRQRKCEVVDSRCLKEVKGKCLLFEQTYVCYGRRGPYKRVSLKGEIPFCLDGNCDDRGWAANQDFAEALSKLAIFNEMDKDKDEKCLTVFRGEALRCTKHCFSFTDCCASFSGWGINSGLSRCSEQEKALAQKRQAGKCVFVGTYCAEKVFGKCIRKKSTYCCFETKLSRIIHEQGRRQLGIGWGEAENPQCRPFTVEELQRIDFGKIDLSELYADLTSKVTQPDYKKVTQGISQNIQNKVSQFSKRDVNKAPKDFNLPQLPQEQKGETKDVVF